MLQSRLLCALKRRKDNPINCSLQIKALFCRFPPRSGPALLMTCPPTWDPSQGGPPGTAPHPQVPKCSTVGSPEKAAFSFSCWSPRRRNLKEFVPLIFLGGGGQQLHLFIPPPFFWSSRNTHPKVNLQPFSAEKKKNMSSRSQSYQGFFHRPGFRQLSKS